jgi:hypothetical protein
MNPEDEEFDPDDIEELNATFDALIHDAEAGFTIEFICSRMGAKDLVRTWLKAAMGDQKAMKSCFKEYSKIMEHLIIALKEED